MKKKLTLSVLKSEIKRIDLDLEKDEMTYNAAIVLLSSLVVGANIKKIAKFAHLPRKLVSTFASRLWESGVWDGSNVVCDWFEEGVGGMNFLCDVVDKGSGVERA